jgi:hypothetical protein
MTMLMTSLLLVGRCGEEALRLRRSAEIQHRRGWADVVIMTLASHDCDAEGEELAPFERSPWAA